MLTQCFTYLYHKYGWGRQCVCIFRTVLLQEAKLLSCSLKPRLADWEVFLWYFVYTCQKLRKKKGFRMIPLKLKTWPSIPMEVERDESAVLHRKISKRFCQKLGGHERHWTCISWTDKLYSLEHKQERGVLFLSEFHSLGVA